MKNPLIIERPDLQVWQQKTVFGLLTALFWGIWLYLWLPVVTLIGWVFFGVQFQYHMLTLKGYEGFFSTLIVYSVVIVVMGGGLIIWAKYNHLRFRGVDRRRQLEPPTVDDLASYFAKTANEISQWQTLKTVVVAHDEKGGILSIGSRQITSGNPVLPLTETLPPARESPPHQTA